MFLINHHHHHLCVSLSFTLSFCVFLPNPLSEMYVVKRRDNRKEPVHFDKITSRIRKLCYGLSMQFIDPVEIAQKVCAGIYAGITTSQIDELAAETAAQLVIRHSDYGLLAARIFVSNLHKNTHKSFSSVIELLHGESPQIAEDVYGIVMDNKAEIDGAIVYSRDFTYDYFGIRTLERSYLMRVDGRVVERPQHMLMRTAIGLHKSDIKAAIETYNLLSQKWFTHASPTLFNAGTPRPQLSSCFLVAMKGDSIEGIYDTLKECACISKSAGGIGLHLHNVRATGSASSPRVQCHRLVCSLKP